VSDNVSDIAALPTFADVYIEIEDSLDEVWSLTGTLTSNITKLQTGLDSTMDTVVVNQGLISTLQTDVNIAEAGIDSLQSATRFYRHGLERSRS